MLMPSLQEKKKVDHPVLHLFFYEVNLKPKIRAAHWDDLVWLSSWRAMRVSEYECDVLQDLAELVPSWHLSSLALPGLTLQTRRPEEEMVQGGKRKPQWFSVPFAWYLEQLILSLWPLACAALWAWHCGAVMVSLYRTISLQSSWPARSEDVNFI